MATWSSVAGSGVACAGFTGALPVVPGVCVPRFVASGRPPAGVSVYWGCVFGGAASGWRPGLVLSCLDCDYVGRQCIDVVSYARAAWELSDSFCGVPPVIASLWLLPSGAAVVASVTPLRRPVGVAV